MAKEVELFIGCHNYATNIIFSHTDYYTSPFVNIDFNSWSEVLLNLLNFFDDSLRIYNSTSLITGALEYDKFEKRFVVDYGLWDCYSESYQNIYNNC